MFKQRLLAVLAGLLLMGGSLYAQTNSFRIGFVDVSRTFDEYPGTKKATEDLKAEVEKRRPKIEALQTEVGTLQKELETIKDPKEREKKEAVLAQKKKELKGYRDEANTFVAKREEELTQGIIAKIYEAIKKVAIENKVSIVIEKNSILYGAAELDLTDAVIKVLKGE